MKTVMNTPRDLDVLAYISLDARVTFQCDGEEPETLRLSRDVICDAVAWESELIWQAVKAIAAKHGGHVEAREALEQVSAALRSETSGQ